LGILPEPGALAVDVGCGEGRVARELRERGHTVVGIEGSEALAAAAREADPDFEVHAASAAAMPLDDGAADLAVASMSLLNMDDLDGVVREVTRILRPGGRFVFSTVHPARSLKQLGDSRNAARTTSSATRTRRPARAVASP
jgi:ubiquinone/menaquinone biosynthesis C-methylase UbiE